MGKWKHILLFSVLALMLAACVARNDRNLALSTVVRRPASSTSTPTGTLRPQARAVATVRTGSTTPATPSQTATLDPTYNPAASAIASIPPAPHLTAPVHIPTATTLPGATPILTAHEYLALIDLGIDVMLQYVAWEADGMELVYAVTRPEALSAEPKDWAWWRYDLGAREKELLPPPKSRVTEEIRQQLDVCPTGQEPLELRSDCSGYSILLESMTSERIVFSPLSSHGDDTWLANIDGTNRLKLETPIESPSYAQWSSDGRWLLLSVHFPGLPGQMTHYLVRADGSYEIEFGALTGHDLFLLNGLFPQFRPDGLKLAYVGSNVFDSLDENDYGLYLLDLETFMSTHVSERVGMFEWSASGTGLYLLDDAFFHFSVEDHWDPQSAALYFIDLTQTPFAERLIASDLPYLPQNSTGTWLWSYSPPAKAIAYVGNEHEELGILFLGER